MLEREIETYFVKEVVKAGGLAFKLNAVGNAGVPDRIAIMPRGKIAFIELKAPGEKTRPIQDLQIKRLLYRGHKVYVIDSKNAVNYFISDITL